MQGGREQCLEDGVPASEWDLESLSLGPSCGEGVIPEGPVLCCEKEQATLIQCGAAGGSPHFCVSAWRLLSCVAAQPGT